MSDLLSEQQLAEIREGRYQVRSLAAADEHITALLAEVERLKTAEHTDWRAWHDSDGIGFGQYTTRAAAMDHVHHLLAREENTTAQAIELRVMWRADDPDAEDTAWECWLHDADGADDKPTGYVVSPITVAAAYDPDGDE